MVSKLLGLAAAGAVGTVFGLVVASFEGRLAHLSGYRSSVPAGFVRGFTTFSFWLGLRVGLWSAQSS